MTESAAHYLNVALDETRLQVSFDADELRQRLIVGAFGCAVFSFVLFSVVIGSCNLISTGSLESRENGYQWLAGFLGVGFLLATVLALFSGNPMPDVIIDRVRDTVARKGATVPTHAIAHIQLTSEIEPESPNYLSVTAILKDGAPWTLIDTPALTCCDAEVVRVAQRIADFLGVPLRR